MIDRKLRVLFHITTLAVYAFLLAGCQSWFPSTGSIGGTGSSHGGSGPPAPGYWESLLSTEHILMGVATLLVLCSIASVVVPVFLSKPPCLRCALSCAAGWIGCLVWLFIIKNAVLLIVITMIGGAGFAAYALWQHKWSLSRTLADSTPLTPDTTGT